MKTKGKSKKDNISSEEKTSLVLGKIIKEARKKAELSLDELAFAVNISKEYIRLLENGQIKEPGLIKIVNIFYLFGLDINILNEIFLDKIKSKESLNGKNLSISQIRQLLKEKVREGILNKKS